MRCDYLDTQVGVQKHNVISPGSGLHLMLVGRTRPCVQGADLLVLASPRLHIVLGQSHVPDIVMMSKLHFNCEVTNSSAVMH